MLGVSPAELAGTVVPLDDLWHRTTARIRDAGSWRDRFALTETLLAHRGPTVDPEVGQVWHRIATGEDAATVAADSGYVDQSHLHRDVRACTGTTPATVAGGEWLAVDDLAWPA